MTLCLFCFLLAISSFREAQKADKVNEALPMKAGKRKVSQKSNKVIFFRKDQQNGKGKGKNQNNKNNNDDEHKEQYKITTTDSNKKSNQ